MRAPFHRENWHDRLHVVTVISNPMRFRSRFDLYCQFAERMEAAGATLWTVEMAFGERSHAITAPNHPRHIQLRTRHELWHKENAINLAFAHITARVPTANYFAWIDADVDFSRNDWHEETIHQLQHHPIVQMFGECVDLGPNHEHLRRQVGFARTYRERLAPIDEGPRGRGACGRSYVTRDGFFHPGYAWAARREALDALGGLIDWTIVGGGDWYMAWALVGLTRKALTSNCSPAYRARVLQWEERAVRYLRKNVGYTPGVLLHHWHGKKKQRGYGERWRILARTQFDPCRDIKRDAQGLWQLEDHGDARSIELREELFRFFRGRNEDSIDLE